MSTKRTCAPCNVALAGIVVVLAISVVFLAGAAFYFQRMAIAAKQAAETAAADATASVDRERYARQYSAELQLRADSYEFRSRYYDHILGVHVLSEAELPVVRISMSNDAQVGLVVQTFENDMASVNRLLASAVPVGNYHDAVVACCRALEREGKEGADGIP